MPVGSTLSATRFENTQAPEGYFGTLMENIFGLVRGKRVRLSLPNKGRKEKERRNREGKKEVRNWPK